MFRGPQLLNWACLIRPLLQQREYLTALSQYAASGLHNSVTRRRRKQCSRTERSSLVCKSALTGHSLHSRNILPFYKLSSKYQPAPVVSTFLKAGSKRWKSTIGSSDNDCIVNRNCLQPQRKPMVVQQHSLSLNKTHCSLFKQNHLCCHSFGRSFNSSVSTPKHNLVPYGASVHQTAAHEVAVWRDCLSAENEHRCRQNLESNLKLYEVKKEGRAPALSLGKKQARWASVLVSLCSVEEEPAFLFTLRSSMLKGRHKGDVSFAGGKSDPSDEDVVATALREAREELGVNVPTERVWGVLKPLREVSGMMVAPVLANLGPLEELSFKPNPGEVEEIFTLSLCHLCDPRNRGYTHFRTGDKYGYTLPVFRNGKHRVWGLTAIALDHTIKLIVPS